jgi:hypothetical protein
MLGLTQGQRILLAEKLCDAANLVAGALLVGQLVGDQPFSVILGLSGLLPWVAILAFAVWLGSDRGPE